MSEAAERAREAGRVDEAVRLHQAIMVRMDADLPVLTEEIRRRDPEAARRN
jgi:hypothetical protein